MGDTPGFLAGGGEMGALIRAHDWAATPLGSPEGWPQALRTVVRLMLTTNHPVFVFWGPDHVCLYNDAYRGSLGPEKHPAMLGAPGEAMWGETWGIIGPQIETVMAGGGATWHEDHLVPILRHGRIEEVYWTYSYSPIDDGLSEGGVGGVLVLSNETTRRVLDERRRESDARRLEDLFHQAPAAVAVLRGPEHRFEVANPAYRELVGGRDVVGLPVAEALPEVVGQGFVELLDRVRDAGEVHVGRGTPVLLRRSPADPAERRVLDFVYQPLRDDTGAVSGIFVLATDVTDAAQAHSDLRDSEERLRLIVEGARDYAILTTDAERMVTSFSPGAERAFGVSAARMLGTSADLLFTPEDREDGVPRREASAAASEGSAPDHRWHQRADGTRVFMNGSTHPLPRDAEGRERGFIKIARDETRQRAQAEALRLSEARFRAVQETSIDGFMVLDSVRDEAGSIVDFRWAYANAAAEGIVGRPRDFFLGRLMLDVMPGNRDEGLFDAYVGVVETGEPWTREFSYRHDGVDAFLRAVAAKAGDGFAVTFADLSERRRTEDALRAESETQAALIATQRAVAAAGGDLGAMFDALVAGAMAAAARCDGAAVELVDGDALVYSAVAGSLSRHLGLTMSRTGSLSGRCVSEARPLVTEEAEADERVDRAAVRLTGLRSTMVVPIFRRGEAVGVLKLASGQPHAFGEREVALAQLLVGTLASGFADASEAAVARALRESEARLRAVFDAAPVGIVFAEAPSGRIVGGNRRTEEILRHPVYLSPDPDAYAEWVSFHVDGRRVDSHEYPLSRVIEGGEERPDMEVDYQRGDGTRTWVRLIGAPILDDVGATVGAVVTVLDIDREKRAEAELRRINEGLEAEVAARTADRDRMWRLSDEVMLVARFDGTITAVNPAWTAMLGWREARSVGRSFLDLVHPDDVGATTAEAGRLSRGRKVLRFENRYRHKDGTYRWLSWTAVPGEGLIHAVGRDVTDEKVRQEELEHTQAALRQSQKMEAVGQLTGGIAHDFNNLLTGILGSLDLLQKRVATGRIADLERYATVAITAAQRAAALTQRLLAFSRRQPLDPKPVDGNKLVAGMEDLLRRTLGPMVDLEMVLAGGLWPTLCDPNQLESAILNLAINARDAMPEGGRLTIETANAHLDDAYVRSIADGVTAGQYASIAVTDTGTGIPPDVAARMFEPFFTTKPLGQGTGLGLSQLYGFVKQSGGHVAVYSEPGQGTTFRLYLPRHLGGEDRRDSPASDGTSVPRAEGETVLIVEDEAAVRMLIVETLEELGYAAIEAADGPTGLAILQSNRRVDLLVTDVGLPGLNGRQVADAARLRRPDLKVLFITGFAGNAAVGNGMLEAGMEILTKPFAMDALAAKLRAMIES